MLKHRITILLFLGGILICSSDGVGQAMTSQQIIKAKIQHYYKAIESHNFDWVKPFYADTMACFFDRYNVIPDQDLRAVFEIYWKDRVKEERHKINWNDWQYQEDTEGNHIVTYRFRYDYKLIKPNEADEVNQWKSVQRKLEMRFNKNYLIYYIKSVH